MLKVSSFRLNARTKSFAPLMNCIVVDALLRTMPDIDQTLLQFIDVIKFGLVDTLFHLFPNSVVHWFQIGTFGGHKSGEMNADVSCCSRRLNVSRARCARALSSWEIKNSQRSLAWQAAAAEWEAHYGNMHRRFLLQDQQYQLCFPLLGHAHWHHEWLAEIRSCSQ